MEHFGEKKQPMNTDAIFLNIRKRILKLQLEPGQKISENQMADEYGVSRSVIHSSFVRLNQLGLVDVYPQRGTYVSLINLRYIENLLILRCAVEKEAVYELFERLDMEKRQTLIDKLEKNLEQQDLYRTCEEYDLNFQKLDSEFHKIIIASVDRYQLVEILGDLMIHLVRWRNFDVAFDNRMPEVIMQHRDIVNAMKTGDYLKVQSAIATHLETISYIRDRAMEKYPQYFIEK